MLNPEQILSKVHDAALAHRRGGMAGREQMRIWWLQLCEGQLPFFDGIDGKATYMIPRPVACQIDAIGKQVPVLPQRHPYRVGAVDGSQVYPDHHEGVPFFLVHAAAVFFEYGETAAASSFSDLSQVSVHSLYDWEEPSLGAVALVDRMRSEAELRLGRELVMRHFPVLFDGSLVFWHLAAQNAKNDKFFRSYCAILQEYALLRIPTAWYTSLPQGRDFVNLVRMALGDLAVEELHRGVIDTDLLGGWLQKHCRSEAFFSGADIAAFYPDEVKPAFFYLNTGEEIARVEVPAWIAVSCELCDGIAAIIIDQCDKGGGYPISLAEAHEHAVVRSSDRELFFVSARRMLEDGQHQLISISRKSSLKRHAGF